MTPGNIYSSLDLKRNTIGTKNRNGQALMATTLEPVSAILWALPSSGLD